MFGAPMPQRARQAPVADRTPRRSSFQTELQVLQSVARLALLVRPLCSLSLCPSRSVSALETLLLVRVQGSETPRSPRECKWASGPAPPDLRRAAKLQNTRAHGQPVALGALSKGRSSSRKVNFLLKKVAGLLSLLWTPIRRCVGTNLGQPG